MDLEKLAKKMLKQKLTLSQLGIGIKTIREMKKKGYNIKAEQKENNDAVYWVRMIDKDNHYIISPRNSEVKAIKYAEVSDIHAGAQTFDEKGFRWFLQLCKDMGIRHIHNSGDTVDGISVYRGHVNYLKYTREEDQVKCVADIIGEYDFKWIAIDGNHDLSWINKGAPSPNQMLSQMVDNYTYVPGIGADKVVRADLVIEGVMKRLVHPWTNSGNAYAKSYPGQVYLRRVMDNGVMFDIGDKKYHLKLLQYGHLHYDMVYETFGVKVTHPLSFQKPNDFTEGRGLGAARGGRITTLTIHDGEILECDSKAYTVPENI